MSNLDKYLWLTDIHLNHVTLEAAEAFLLRLREQRAQGIFLTGDLAEQPETGLVLDKLCDFVECPIYFVLGNHDFYFSSIAQTRKEIDLKASQSSKLHYLPRCAPIWLRPDLVLLGVDGWADGRAGDYMRSLIFMNDYRWIEELAGVDKLKRWEILRSIAAGEAQLAKQKLAQVSVTTRQVYFLTHLPPFREACWYQGQTSNDEWAPHFVCISLGEELKRAALANPHCQFTVLCGHTHSRGQARILDNLLVLTGGAEYGSPTIEQEVWI